MSGTSLLPGAPSLPVASSTLKSKPVQSHFKLKCVMLERSFAARSKSSKRENFISLLCSSTIEVVVLDDRRGVVLFGTVSIWSASIDSNLEERCFIVLIGCDVVRLTERNTGLQVVEDQPHHVIQTK